MRSILGDFSEAWRGRWGSADVLLSAIPHAYVKGQSAQRVDELIMAFGRDSVSNTDPRALASLSARYRRPQARRHIGRRE